MLDFCIFTGFENIVFRWLDLIKVCWLVQIPNIKPDILSNLTALVYRVSVQINVRVHCIYGGTVWWGCEVPGVYIQLATGLSFTCDILIELYHKCFYKQHAGLE